MKMGKVDNDQINRCDAMFFHSINASYQGRDAKDHMNFRVRVLTRPSIIQENQSHRQ